MRSMRIRVVGAAAATLPTARLRRLRADSLVLGKRVPILERPVTSFWIGLVAFPCVKERTATGVERYPAFVPPFETFRAESERVVVAIPDGLVETRVLGENRRGIQECQQNDPYLHSAPLGQI